MNGGTLDGGGRTWEPIIGRGGPVDALGGAVAAS
jgi:hypothetical protein